MVVDEAVVAAFYSVRRRPLDGHTSQGVQDQMVQSHSKLKVPGWSSNQSDLKVRATGQRPIEHIK